MENPAPVVGESTALTVSRRFIELAENVVCHRDAARFVLLHRLLLRLQDEPRLLDNAADADIARAESMARSVRRDLHKMTAFVRFRAVSGAGEEGPFIAWFEPQHFILERAASFFMGRFAGMIWSIMTPQGSLYWDGTALQFGPAASKTDAPDGDAMEAYWLTYYANIFNPARLKVRAMTQDTYFQQLLTAAAAQTEPQRLLFVFAAAELPDHPTQAQREAFLAGRGGALAPVMCVDKAVGELTDFDSLAAESKDAGPPWRVVFAAALAGRGGLPPSKAEIDTALKSMVEAVRIGAVSRYGAFGPDGELLNLH